MGYFRPLGTDYRYPGQPVQAQRQNLSTAYLEYCLDQQLYQYLLRGSPDHTRCREHTDPVNGVYKNVGAL